MACFCLYPVPRNLFPVLRTLYPDSMDLVINGQPRTFPALTAGSTLQDLLTALALKSDRVAVEHNGAIVSRPSWSTTPVSDGDKFEIVHFVGGGKL